MRAIRTTVISILAGGVLAGSTVGVAAQDDPLVPAAVTGTVSPVTEASPAGEMSLLEGFGVLSEGVVFTNTWDTSDPRLNGVSTVSANLLDFREQRMQVGAADIVLENDAGRWTGQATVMEGERLGETETYVLRGEGAYDGLNAYVVIERPSGPDGGSLNAAVFPGVMPSFPSPSSE